MKSTLSSVGLYARTLRHLRIAQIYHRARLKAQRVLLGASPSYIQHRWEQRRVTGEWPKEFLPLSTRTEVGYPDPNSNSKLKFKFLNETRDLGVPPNWNPNDASQLWRYHLHYFDWAWSFLTMENPARAQDAFVSLWLSWRASTSFPKGDAWHPYVVSVRTWNWCGIYDELVKGTAAQNDFLNSLHLQGCYLARHLELDVGGNHLLKNIKALIGLGVFFDNDRWRGDGRGRLEKELETQVLFDGGHYERSPSYHCQVLGDLLDVSKLLEVVGDSQPKNMIALIASMRRWLGAMLAPDGDVPLFNDCGLVGSTMLDALQPEMVTDQFKVFPQSGYAVVRPDDRSYVVVDFGDPCPEDLPAHAHADCLSFELSIDGARVIVNSGTSTYSGPRRHYERSTRAHNTFEIDGENQTEVWGQFRAARRARPTLERTTDDAGVVQIQASHDGYRNLEGSPIHRRTWRARPGSIEIDDEVSGEGHHLGRAFLHLAPGTKCAPGEAKSLEVGPVKISAWGNNGPLDIDVIRSGNEALVSSSQGRLQSSTCLVVKLDGPLPLRLRLAVEWDARGD